MVQIKSGRYELMQPYYSLMLIYKALFNGILIFDGVLTLLTLECYLGNKRTSLLFFAYFPLEPSFYFIVKLKF